MQETFHLPSFWTEVVTEKQFWDNHDMVEENLYRSLTKISVAKFLPTYFSLHFGLARQSLNIQISLKKQLTVILMIICYDND